MKALTSLALLAVLIPLTACGRGGGGGSGGGGGPNPDPEDGVSFLGFAFRIGDQVSSTPPLENPNASPPTLGGPLTTTVIFQFDGPPSGPFSQTSLPVFTTPGEVAPSVGAPASNPVIPAKGTYVLVGNDVEFRPFVPTQPLQTTIGAPPASVPGLFPGSVYTATVSTNPLTKISNLTGPGGQVKFGTTSNPAAFFPQDPDSLDAPVVASTIPADGTTGFFPSSFSTTPLGSSTPFFPAGPDSVLITYDRALLPTAGNLNGTDVDGDGVIDGNFYLRSQATRLLVAHEVPANTFGAHGAFAALSGLTAGEAPDADGDDVVLQGGNVLADPDPNLAAQPVSLAPGRDPDLLFAILEVLGGSDLFTVADRLLGDPQFAQLAVSPDEGAPAGTLDTGLESVVGLTTLLDGRLVAYDQATDRIYQLTPTVVRRRPAPDEPAQPPILAGLSVGDGVSGFRSEPVVGVGGPLILDLAQSPTGELYALAQVLGESFPSILRLQPIDPDADGDFEPDEGTYLGGADLVLGLSSAYADMSFEGDHTVLALNRSTDTIDRIDLLTGNVSAVVAGVAAFDMPLGGFPDGLSPARALAVGFLEQDADVELVGNASSGALVRIRPAGILPIGQEVAVMQRNPLTSLAGGSEVVSNPGEPVALLGAKTVTTVVTADSPDTIDDVFLEDFSDKQYEATSQNSLGPAAEWAKPVSGGLTTGVLRASTGLSEVAALGDFLPQPRPGFKPNLMYVRGPLAPPDELVGNNGSSNLNQGAGNGTQDYVKDHDVSTSQGVYREVFLNTDSQSFPLPDGSTPGITAPTTVTGGKFAFRDFIVPAGVRVIARGSNPLVITAERDVVIAGMIDVAGTEGLLDDSFDSGFLPVRGGPGGPGGGRGGDAHPTKFDPNGPNSLDQYVTPETAESGFGPVVSPSGVVTFEPVGGRGAVSTAGYRPADSNDPAGGAGTPTPAGPPGFPDMPGFTNGNDWLIDSEIHRPPGGGGGSFRTVGQPSHYGAGAYLVQSDSTYFPFSVCGAQNDKIQFIQYGNEENRARGLLPNNFLQCVYMVGTPGNIDYRRPGTLPGISPFKDSDPDNDFLGEGGEIPVLIGGQGGGGGGTKVDSIDHSEWSMDRLGTPGAAFPFYPLLVVGPLVSPTTYDSKGGGGGGGGGAVQIRSFGDIRIARTGYIDASGGLGGGGEVIGNSNGAGGGGGGSGGAILLQAAGDIIIESDPTNTEAGYLDADDGAQGAALDVSGGFGDDAYTDSGDPNSVNPQELSYDHSRGDGGQGGMGLIQLQAGAELIVQQGATLFANQRAVLKYGDGSSNDGWNTRFANDQRDHPNHQGLYSPVNDNDIRPFQLRYIDLLHYRFFNNDDSGPVDHYYTLNGAFPPIIPHDTGDMGQDIIHEFPADSGSFWGDTKMMEHPGIPGLMVVQEPQPEKRIAEMSPIEDSLRRVDENGPFIISNLQNAVDQLFNPNNYFPDLYALYGRAPGIPHAPDDEIPFAVRLSDSFMAKTLAEVPMNQTTGNPVMIDIGGGQMVQDPATLVTRLPVVHPDLLPQPLSGTSRGISEWLDFSGATLRMRAMDGVTPPFFGGINGTFNAAAGQVPDGQAGEVQLAGPAPLAPTLAKLVKNAEAAFFGGIAQPGEPPLNDIKVNAPDVMISSTEQGIENAVSNNATVSLLFQGAYGVRAGSHVPDLSTITPWVADLTQLDGYPLVRFQVVFTLNNNPSMPFGVDSLRPAVDFVRLRPSY